MVRCVISDTQFSSDRALRWAREGVEFVQLRDKSADAGLLAERARELLRLLDSSATRVLINSRADVAAAVGAAGVHLTSHQDELRPEQMRAIFAKAGRPSPVVSISCHTIEEVQRAQGQVDLILFAPVFEKRVAGEVVTAGVGLEALRAACAAAGPTPVLAMGGVTQENAALCVEAGAAGMAGIRRFNSA